jgi:hypothetical protein
MAGVFGKHDMRAVALAQMEDVAQFRVAEGFRYRAIP